MNKKELFVPFNEELIEKTRQDQRNPKDIFVWLQRDVDENGDNTLVVTNLTDLTEKNETLYFMPPKDAVIPIVVTEATYQNM